MPVKIEWLGHCCFRLTRADGLRILIDPFDDAIGHNVPDYSCDILLVTHPHYDTAAVHAVPKGYDLVDMKGTTLVNDIAFNAFPLFHDERLGKDYGTTLVFHFELDGLKIGYMGHIGEYPKSWVLEKLGKLDILFVPVGGHFTIGPNDAMFLVKELKPGIVIPMHFKTHHLNFTLLPRDTFVKLVSNYFDVGDWKVELGPEDIPEAPLVLLMQHWPGIDP